MTRDARFVAQVIAAGATPEVAQEALAVCRRIGRNLVAQRRRVKSQAERERITCIQTALLDAEIKRLLETAREGAVN